MDFESFLSVMLRTGNLIWLVIGKLLLKNFNHGIDEFFSFRILFSVQWEVDKNVI